MKRLKNVFMNGFLKENPTFVLVLGMCPTLAVTTSAINGLAMGLAATFVLMCSNLVVSLLKNFIPAKVRIPCFVVVIAAFVTVVQMVMQAFVPSLYQALGIFIPLIVVNCIILGRAEAFASKNNPLDSLIDGLGSGLGFTAALIAIGIIREFLGNGTFFGMTVLGEGFSPVLMMIMAPGGFITLGLLMGLYNKLTGKAS
ncbi:electron transport complex subunit RsxE [Gehongia tenuis]|jgi:electron transport complex protein RnfE|uniref:Ion-translocating oxidoreductase complex subunit E n=1 Tax=Gehongia tenuis TaxID=2763655 RepID=A0A926HL09_9FIRM|nr:electron transport complex subunit E [Gehongia tenuis]MBC8531557.1 electron transport complex subunit E [Gehongia tenuis]